MVDGFGNQLASAFSAPIMGGTAIKINADTAFFTGAAQADAAFVSDKETAFLRLPVDNGQPERRGKVAKFGRCGFVKINLVHKAYVSDGLENSGRLNVLIDVQAFHAVAHRAEADAQSLAAWVRL